MSHRDYVSLCVGHRNKTIKAEYLQREVNYNIIMGWADQKKMPKKHIWWPIAGEPIKKIKLPSKAKLLAYDAMFRNLGRNKNG